MDAINIETFIICPECAKLGGWQCEPCMERGVRRDREKGELCRRVAAQAKRDKVERICSRFELESDEMMTREEKALDFLN